MAGSIVNPCTWVGRPIRNAWTLTRVRGGSDFEMPRLGIDIRTPNAHCLPVLSLSHSLLNSGQISPREKSSRFSLKTHHPSP